MEGKKMEPMMESLRFNQSGNCKKHLRLEMGSLSQSEEFTRVATTAFMNKLNPTLEEVGDAKAAVSETVTNTVIHSYQGQGGIIHMKITTDTRENVLKVCVKDTEVGIVDVKRVMKPMFTADPEDERSDVGFSLMEVFMDQVDVQSEPGKETLVSMKKFIGR